MHRWNGRQPRRCHLSASEAADTSRERREGSGSSPLWRMWPSTGCELIRLVCHKGPFTMTATAAKLETAPETTKVSTKNVAFGGSCAPPLISKREYWPQGRVDKEVHRHQHILEWLKEAFCNRAFCSAVIGHYRKSVQCLRECSEWMGNGEARRRPTPRLSHTAVEKGWRCQYWNTARSCSQSSEAVVITVRLLCGFMSREERRRVQ